MAAAERPDSEVGAGRGSGRAGEGGAGGRSEVRGSHGGAGLAWPMRDGEGCGAEAGWGWAAGRGARRALG